MVQLLGRRQFDTTEETLRDRAFFAAAREQGGRGNRSCGCARMRDEVLRHILEP